MAKPPSSALCQKSSSRTSLHDDQRTLTQLAVSPAEDCGLLQIARTAHEYRPSSYAFNSNTQLSLQGDLGINSNNGKRLATFADADAYSPYDRGWRSSSCLLPDRNRSFGSSAFNAS